MWDNEAWSTHTHSHQKVSPLQLPGFYWRVMESVGGIKMMQMVYFFFFCIKCFPICVLCMIWHPRVSVITLWMCCICVCFIHCRMSACGGMHCACLHVNFFWCLVSRCIELLVESFNKIIEEKKTTHTHTSIIHNVYASSRLVVQILSVGTHSIHSPVCHIKAGLVCVSRPGQGWLSGQYEGILLQCKETAVVRLLLQPRQL